MNDAEYLSEVEKTLADTLKELNPLKERFGLMVAVHDGLEPEQVIRALREALARSDAKSEQRKDALKRFCEESARNWMADGSVFYSEGKVIMDAIGDD